jgi:hypothetical protein
MIELLRELREQVTSQGQNRIDGLLALVRVIAPAGANRVINQHRLSTMLLMPPLACEKTPTSTMKQKVIKTKTGENTVSTPTWEARWVPTTKTLCEVALCVLQASQAKLRMPAASTACRHIGPVHILAHLCRLDRMTGPSIRDSLGVV